jgi:DNA-binding transcriptional LysR family regulator
MSNRSEALPFDLRALDIFIAVCEAGSMAAAARALGLTQPAVSQAIADLEERTGTMLFDRRVRPIGLTPAGGVMRQRAAALLSEARQIAPMLRETERGRFALLRVGLVDSLARALTTTIAIFLKDRAEQVHVRSGLTAAHAGALLTRNLDLFIGVDEMVEIAGLERIELMREPYILLLPPGVAAPKTPIELQTLFRRYPLSRYSARSKTGIEIERHLRRLNIDAPEGLSFDTPFGVTEMVARGSAIALSTPLCFGEAGYSSTEVVPAPLPGPSLIRTLTLVARRQELARLPRELATVCRTGLEHNVLPELITAMPWLKGQLST